MALLSVHHVGASVASVERALAFWEPFLGVEARWRTVLDGDYIPVHVGYPGATIDAAFVDLPGGGVLELLDYRVAAKVENAEATANPGNVHLCLLVEDIEREWARAVELGARAVADAPVTVSKGPNAGAKAAYLRIHDGITLELFQAKP